MLYFSNNSIVNSFNSIKGKLENKFIGMLGVLRMMDDYIVKPNKTYKIIDGELSKWLDNVCFLNKYNGIYGNSNLYIKLAYEWEKYVEEEFIKEHVNVYSLIIFLYKTTGFKERPSSTDLLSMFCHDYHLPREYVNKWFEMDSITIEYDNFPISLQQIKKSFKITNDTISLASPYSVSARAGELSRAPFIQTLYAGMDSIKCLLILRDDIDKYYSNTLTNNEYRSIINESNNKAYLLALRTKPFLLLAGISGTGKSRIVREFAFKSCPKYLQDKDGTTPGNYCMIEVKPNWHDSTELLGYYSNLSKEYQFKKFVKFLVKAKMYPDVPFFVCLDEMNLAPVEQYFAEVLSILETRKHPRNPETKEVDMKTIKTEVIVEAKYFQQLEKINGSKNITTGLPAKQKLTDRDIYMKLYGIDEEKDINKEVGNKTELTTLGLTLPGNVLIIGTVNMDDTTHQFSRKVIDRAMTIEMNGGNLSAMFGGSKNLEYLEDEAEQQKWQNAFTQRYISADEVLEAHPQEAETIMEKLPERLNELNKALKGTPFEVSYRVLNELTIMVGVLLDDNEEGKSIDDIINQAVDNILLMKILPRIEGDADMFAIKKKDVQYDNRLKWLESIAPDISTDGEEEEKESKQTAREKIHEMIERLDNQEFTRFWP